MADDPRDEKTPFEKFASATKKLFAVSKDDVEQQAAEGERDKGSDESSKA